MPLMDIVDLMNGWLSDESHGKRDIEFLAKRSGLSRSLISRILKRERTVTVRTCKMLAPVLNQPIIKLLRIAGAIPEETGSQIFKSLDKNLCDYPPELLEAIQDPEMQEFIKKVWLLKKNNPGIDLVPFYEKLSDLPQDKKLFILKMIEAL